MPIIIVPAAATATVNMYNAKVCVAIGPGSYEVVWLPYAQFCACLVLRHMLLSRFCPCAAASADGPNA